MAALLRLQRRHGGPTMKRLKLSLVLALVLLALALLVPSASLAEGAILYSHGAQWSATAYAEYESTWGWNLAMVVSGEPGNHLWFDVYYRPWNGYQGRAELSNDALAWRGGSLSQLRLDADIPLDGGVTATVHLTWTGAEDIVRERSYRPPLDPPLGESPFFYVVNSPVRGATISGSVVLSNTSGAVASCHDFVGDLKYSTGVMGVLPVSHQ